MTSQKDSSAEGRKPLGFDSANAIYDVLVAECGATERGRHSFVLNQTHDFVGEYRFMGNLGFGGKFWRYAGRMYVNCYREDETPERKAMIEAANRRIANDI